MIRPLPSLFYFFSRATYTQTQAPKDIPVPSVNKNAQLNTAQANAANADTGCISTAHHSPTNAPTPKSGYVPHVKIHPNPPPLPPNTLNIPQLNAGGIK